MTIGGTDFCQHAVMRATCSICAREAEIAEYKKQIADLKKTLFLFREFVSNNATVWRVGASHHHPMWARVVEALGEANDPKPGLTGEDWELVRRRD